MVSLIGDNEVPSGVVQQTPGQSVYSINNYDQQLPSNPAIGDYYWKLPREFLGNQVHFFIEKVSLLTNVFALNKCIIIAKYNH